MTQLTRLNAYNRKISTSAEDGALMRNGELTRARKALVEAGVDEKDASIMSDADLIRLPKLGPRRVRLLRDAQLGAGKRILTCNIQDAGGFFRQEWRIDISVLPKWARWIAIRPAGSVFAVERIRDEGAGVCLWARKPASVASETVKVRNNLRTYRADLMDLTPYGYSRAVGKSLEISAADDETVLRAARQWAETEWLTLILLVEVRPGHLDRVVLAVQPEKKT